MQRFIKNTFPSQLTTCFLRFRVSPVAQRKQSDTYIFSTSYQYRQPISTTNISPRNSNSPKNSGENGPIPIFTWPWMWLDGDVSLDCYEADKEPVLQSPPIVFKEIETSKEPSENAFTVDSFPSEDSSNVC